MRLIHTAFALLLVFFSSSQVKLSHTEDAPHHLLYSISENLPWLFAAGICRGYLPREFAAGICRGNLPWLFAARICRRNLPWVFCIRKRILFCICEQILFIWKQTVFIYEQNFLICEIFFINSVSFCYCRGSYGPPHYLVFLQILHNLLLKNGFTSVQLIFLKINFIR